jgi:hypothetical protein
MHVIRTVCCKYETCVAYPVVPWSQEHRSGIQEHEYKSQSSGMIRGVDLIQGRECWTRMQVRRSECRIARFCYHH